MLAIAANIAIVALIILRHRGNEHSLAQSQLKVAAPELHNRLARQVAQLESESARDSLSKLSDVDLFFWPGPSLGSGSFGFQHLPLPKEAGPRDLEAICSNRRFCKLVEELAAVDNAALAKMLGDEINRCTTQYRKLYDSELQRFTPIYREENLRGRTGYAGPTFAIGNVKEGEVAIVGLKLKILALVALSGARGLAECKTNIDHVTRLAMKQRQELYDDTTLVPFFRSEMLKWASLYNRQILGTALLEISKAEADRITIARDLDLAWSERQLSAYKAALTEFDLPVRSGVAKPDYSLGSRPLRFLSPMDDAQFDRLITRCGLNL